MALEAMQALRLTGFGPPDVLRLDTVPRPAPGIRDVVVRVSACGVCRHDVLTRSGKFPRAVPPLIIGHQVTGIVEAVGEDVTSFRKGDRVISRTFDSCGDCASCASGDNALCLRGSRFMGDDMDGGYAQYAMASEAGWASLPDAIGFVDGTSLVCRYATAHHALVASGGIGSGMSVVVRGATGGVGRSVVKVGAALGARVIAVCRQPAQVDGLLGIGASEVVVSDESDLGTRVKGLTGSGADVVIDLVGGNGLGDALSAVRPSGVVVLLGSADGAPSTIRAAHLILKNITMRGSKGSTLTDIQKVSELILSGRVVMDPARTIGFSEVVAVHAEIEAGLNLSGPVAIVPDFKTSGSS